MSYIEREPLIKILNGLYNHHLTMRNYAADGATFDCISAVIEAPTADVVEVRHGEWTDKPTGAYSRMQSWCSACGKHSGIGGIESNRHKPYCPNCGADMRGERREE